MALNYFLITEGSTFHFSFDTQALVMLSWKSHLWIFIDLGWDALYANTRALILYPFLWLSPQSKTSHFYSSLIQFLTKISKSVRKEGVSLSLIFCLQPSHVVFLATPLFLLCNFLYSYSDFLFSLFPSSSDSVSGILPAIAFSTLLLYE